MAKRKRPRRDRTGPRRLDRPSDGAGEPASARGRAERPPPGPDRAAQLVRARRARNVGIWFAATMILWLGLQLAGATFGWPPRLVFVFDIAALAAFIAGLYATFRIWQAGRSDDT